MPFDLGPALTKYIESYVAKKKAYADVVNNPIGASSQGHRVEQVAGASGGDVNDTGPICEAYDPELAIILGFELG